MKKIIISIVVSVITLSSIGQVQYGGVIRAKNNGGTIGEIQRNGDALKVYDSILAAIMSGRLSTSISVKNNAGTFGDVQRNNDALKVWDSALAASGITVLGTVKYIRGTPTTLTVTNLNSLANSQTAGWQSARIDNTSTLATDYLINVKVDMANTAPANDKVLYVYACAFYYDGSTWYASSGGTGTLPSGSEGTYTINSTGNNLRLIGVLNYQTADMIVQDTWLLSNAFGNNMPDGFSIIIIDYSGAAIASSGNIVQYTSVSKKIQ